MEWLSFDWNTILVAIGAVALVGGGLWWYFRRNKDIDLNPFDEPRVPRFPKVPPVTPRDEGY